jgi:hypothetical protein
MTNARQKLAQLLAELRELSPSDPPLSPDVLAFLENALANFLGGNARTLDKAFGLVGERGRPPGRSKRTIEKARKIKTLKGGQPLAAIADQAGIHHSRRYLQRLPKRAEQALASEENETQAREIVARLKKRGQ